MTTQILLAEWLEKTKKDYVKSRTYARYQGIILAHINPVFGRLDIAT